MLLLFMLSAFIKLPIKDLLCRASGATKADFRATQNFFDWSFHLIDSDGSNGLIKFKTIWIT